MNARPRVSLLAILATIIASAINISSQAQQNNCGTRTVPISVNSEDGQFDSSLTAANFHATLDGQTLPILSVTPRPALRRVVFMIHASGRMKSTAIIRTSLSLIATLVSRLPAGVEFALVTFSDDPYLDQPFTSDKAKLIATLHRLDDANNWRGSSAVFDAIGFGIQTLSKPSDSDAIILISNGLDNASKTKPAKVLENISQSPIRILTIGIPASEQLGSDRAAFRTGQLHLDELAASSGGESFNLGATDFAGDRRSLHMDLAGGMDLNRIAENADYIIHEMTTGYRLEISLPLSIKKPVGWKLEVSTAEPIKCRYPAKLFPCSPDDSRK